MSASGLPLACPLPRDGETIRLGHGGGGKLTDRLLEQVFLRAFEAPELRDRPDAALLETGGARVAFTTDSYVIRPLFFPGGDIGSLAVHGTANDLAMCGARARWLSAAFVLEEGLSLEVLWRVVRSMRCAADSIGVRIVTGDTKVVERGKGDGLYLNTAGVGEVESPAPVAPAEVRPGDAVIVSGDLGRHGIAILSVREGLAFGSQVESDVGALGPPALDLVRSGVEVHAMRDLTRGGLTSALVEIARVAGVEVEVDETAVPVREDVRGACEVLGLEPLGVANEGRFVAFVPRDQADRALEVLGRHEVASGATLVGRVAAAGCGTVRLRTAIGTERVLEMETGEQLPRIC